MSAPAAPTVLVPVAGAVYTGSPLRIQWTEPGTGTGGGCAPATGLDFNLCPDAEGLDFNLISDA